MYIWYNNDFSVYFIYIFIWVIYMIFNFGVKLIKYLFSKEFIVICNKIYIITIRLYILI